MTLFKRAVLSVAGLVIVGLLAVVVTGSVRPDLVYGAAMGLERSLAGLTEKSVTVDGLSWRYLEGGAEADAPTLLLIHGFSADKDNWTRIARHLEERFHLVVPDLIGFGESDRPLDVDYRIRAQADRLVSFMDTLGIDKAILGGNSMGGYIAGAIAQSDAERVEALWLLAPGGVYGSEPSELITRVLEGRSNPLIPETVEDFDRTLDFVFTERPFVTGSVLRYLAERQVEHRDLLDKIFSDLRYNSRPLEESLDGYPGPTLIVWGEDDRVLHPSGAAVLDAIMPAAAVRFMPGVGHLPMVEAPTETAALLLAWLPAG